MTRRRLRGRRESRLTAHARTKPHSESGHCACARGSGARTRKRKRRAGTQERSSRHTGKKYRQNNTQHRGDCHEIEIRPCQPGSGSSAHTATTAQRRGSCCKALHPPMAGIRAAPLKVCHPISSKSLFCTNLNFLKLVHGGGQKRNTSTGR